MRRGPGRPPHPDVLTPSEWRVLEQLRAGKPNAEIAVRLGVSVNTVKYHVANILGKLGVEDREAAAAWDGAPRRVRVVAPVLWLLSRLGVVGGGAVGVTALGAVIVVVAIIGSGGGPEGGGASLVATSEATVAVATSVVVESTESSEVPPDGVQVAAGSTTRVWVLVDGELPFEQHADYRVYGATQLEAAGFVDTGAFLRVPNNPFPVAESSFRAGFTAVRVADAGVVTVEVSETWSFGWLPGTGQPATTDVNLIGDLGNERVQLTLSGEQGVLQRRPEAGADLSLTRILRVGTDGAAFYLDGGGPEDRRPQLIVDMADAQGRSYLAIIDTRGHLWVRPAPLVEWPIASDTGEQLSVDGALGPLPSWPGQWESLTRCAGGTCFAVNHSVVGLRVPIDGRASCVDGEDGIAFDLDASGYRIHFQSTRVNEARPPTICDEGFPRDVRERETLSGFSAWLVTAFDGSGAQVDVAIGDEWFWVDVAPPAITECPPCRAGN